MLELCLPPLNLVSYPYWLHHYLVCYHLSRCSRPPLSTMLDEIAPHEEAPVVRHCLDEFMDQPSCVFQKPDVLRAVLGCLPFRDLQMVLAYVVRQHSDAMARAEEGA